MTNTLSLWLGALIVGALAVDLVVFSGENLLFLTRKFMELTEWVAFWR